MQTAAIITGLPFACILILMMVSLYKGLSKEHARLVQSQKETDFAAYQDKLKSVVDKRKKNNQI